MTTTPTIWRPKFPVDDASAPGAQGQPQSIGLANGNMLVVWTDDSDPSSPGQRIVGRLLDPLGEPFGPLLPLSSVASNDGLGDASIAAHPDGGFVIAYEARVPGTTRDFVAVERYDSAGILVAARSISDDASISDPQITVNGTGDYIVAYKDEDENETHALVFDRVTNDPGPRHVNTTQNAQYDYLNGIDTFANGGIIAISHEWDSSFAGGLWYTTEIRITSATGSPVRGPVHVARSKAHEAVAEDVAVLAGGQFVALYQSDGFIGLKVGSVTPTG